MMKLFKYDWKRNGVTIVATLIVFLAAQIALTTAGRLNDWNESVIYAVTATLYGIVGFLAILMACQTFNSNIKAYSRRLLPLPSLYTVITPIILLLVSHFVIFLLYLAHDWILSLLFTQDTLLALASQYADISVMAVMVLGYLWTTIFTLIVIFSSITLSQTIEGKAGTFLGIVFCLALFSAISFVESFISPVSDDSTEMGFIRFVTEETGKGMITAEVNPFVVSQWGVVLFEVVVGAALVYGIVYMMNRKLKL